MIPLYNSEKFIDECIRSFLNQKTKYQYELVLVNDGSTDKTLELAEGYQRSYPERIKLISQKNQGISVARNTGIINSTGKYIGFADHDDWVAESYVEELLSAAFDENADIVKCEFAVVKNGKIDLSESRAKRVIKGGMKSDLFVYPSYIWGGIYHRSLIENVRFPVGFWYEDMTTRFLLYQQSKVFVDIGKVLYYKRSHSNNASKVVWSSRQYKCLEQLYLPEILYQDALTLGLAANAYSYGCILLEYSAIFVSRTEHLPETVRQQAFLYARDTLSKIYRPEYDTLLTPKQRGWNRTILEKHYQAWKTLRDI